MTITSRYSPSRRILLLIALYGLMFGLPQLVWGIHAGGWFWAAIVSSILFGIFVFFRGTVTLQFYYIYFVFVMLLGYFVQVKFGIQYIKSTVSPSPFDLRTVAFIDMHFVGLMLGAAVRKSKPVKPIMCERLQTEFWIVGLLIFSVLAIAFVVFAGTGPLFTIRNEMIDLEVSGVQRTLANVLKACPFVYLAFLSGRLRTGHVRLRDIAAATIVFVAAVAFANPANTARFISLTAVLLVIAAWLGQTSKSRHLLMVTVIGALASMILLPTTSMLRKGFNQVDISAIGKTYSRLEFASIQMLIDGIKYSSHLPSGNVLITDLLPLMPPALLPASWRADPIGPSIASGSSYVFDNASIPSFFSGYLDGGIVGLILFSMLMGYVMQAAAVASRTDMRNRRDGYSLILFACVPILARGDLRTAMSAIYEFIIAYEIFLFATRIRMSSLARNRLASDQTFARLPHVQRSGHI